MPTQRQVLERLKRDELLQALDAFELEVADRRRKDDLVDTLARSRKARLHDVLTALPRARLKEICRDFDLDDGGREKAVLADRLTGQGAAPSPEPASPARKPGRPRKTTDAGPPPEPAVPDPEVVAHEAHDAAVAGKLTTEQLERYL